MDDAEATQPITIGSGAPALDALISARYRQAVWAWHRAQGSDPKSPAALRLETRLREFEQSAAAFQPESRDRLLEVARLLRLGDVKGAQVAFEARPVATKPTAPTKGRKDGPPASKPPTHAFRALDQSSRPDVVTSTAQVGRFLPAAVPSTPSPPPTVPDALRAIPPAPVAEAPAAPSVERPRTAVLTHPAPPMTDVSAQAISVEAAPVPATHVPPAPADTPRQAPVAPSAPPVAAATSAVAAETEPPATKEPAAAIKVDATPAQSTPAAVAALATAAVAVPAIGAATSSAAGKATAAPAVVTFRTGPRVSRIPAGGVTMLVYLALLTIGELVVTFVSPLLVFPLHGGIAALAAAQLAYYDHRSEGDTAHPLESFLLAFIVVPLIRVISLTLPLASIEPAYRYLFAGIPMTLGALLVATASGFSRRDIGLTWRRPSLQVVVIIVSIGLGFAEYAILRPAALGPLPWIIGGILPALAVGIATGFPEELIFRGILQRATRPILGVWNWIYVGAIFAVLHIGYQSGLDLAFVFGVGLLYGLVVERSRSIIGTSIGHGVANVVLFFVAPNLPLVVSAIAK